MVTLIVTSENRTIVIDDAMTAGADAVFVKPTPDAIMSQVTLLRERRAQLRLESSELGRGRRGRFDARAKSLCGEPS